VFQSVLSERYIGAFVEMKQPQQICFQLVMKSFRSKILYDTIHSQLHVHVDYLNILYRQVGGVAPVTCSSYSGSQTTLWLPLTQSVE